jgi:hypothetical protein
VNSLTGFPSLISSSICPWLREKVGEKTVIFPNESPVGLDTAHVRAGLDLLAYAYAENPHLVSDWLEALNWAEIQRVHETADPDLSPVALVYSDIVSAEQVFFSPKFLRWEAPHLPGRIRPLFVPPDGR